MRYVLAGHVIRSRSVFFIKLNGLQPGFGSTPIYFDRIRSVSVRDYAILATFIVEICSENNEYYLSIKYVRSTNEKID